MGQFQKARRVNQPMKVSRLERICDLCKEPIHKGDKYGKTIRGTVYCQKCS
jgi:hypothetical protein